MTIDALLRDYRSGARAPSDVIAQLFDAIDARGLAPIWISLVDRGEAFARASAVDLSLPLAGIPFAIKDNIDLAGVATSAGCPSFAYQPPQSATVVLRLMAAGAIPIGKTNLDQFATGLVGRRSPYGGCTSAYDKRYISGGSSSGSALAVAEELAAFSLGTDTAGSGRVPAAFNNLVGMKPTRGLLSTTGVVPACRSLDCVSIFARDVASTATVWRIAQGRDDQDPYSRAPSPGEDAAPWAAATFRFGVPRENDLLFFGDRESAGLYRQAVARLEAIGGHPIEIDFSPFREAGLLLYSGPWVAERSSAIGGFLAGNPPDVHPVVGGIIRGSAAYTAVDVFKAADRLETLKRDAACTWASIDLLALPTAGTIYTTAAVDADPVALNTTLGYYTTFVNLMDLAAVAVPAGFRRDGLPFGISLIAPAFSDGGLLRMAARFTARSSATSLDVPGCVALAVVGAHLTGQPLNNQLTSRGARLVRTCRTALPYRLYALAGTTPPKPGLVRDAASDGHGIEVEVWAIPEDRFGSFVAAVPPPLGIGNIELDTGEWVKGFICEPSGLSGSEEITHFVGWRAYCASRST